MRQGQVAFEYLMIMGVAMIIIVPGAILFYNYSVQSGDDLVRANIHFIGNTILDAVEKVYYLGENSWQTVKVDLPSNTAWIYILGGSELVIGYNTQVGVAEAVFFSDIPLITPFEEDLGGGLKKYYLSDPLLPGSMHPGLTVIKVSSMGSVVMLNETR